MMKSIFRAYAMETIIQYKKNKFNFLKRKLKSQAASPNPSPRPSDMPPQPDQANTQLQFTKKATKTNPNETTIYKSRIENLMKQKSKFSKYSQFDR